MRYVLSSLTMALIITICCVTSCTISLQNIHTEGTASDLVDEDQTASPDVNTDLSLPMKGL